MAQRLKLGIALSKPNPDKARLLAWEVFQLVQSGSAYSHILLPQRLASSDLASRDKAFITELVYGALRMQGHADFVLGQISNRPIEALDADLLELLRFSLYQVLHMRIPPHAAVSANVELARKVIGEAKGSFVNAALRKATNKTLEQWLADAAKEEDEIRRLSIIHSHPEWIVSSYFDSLKDSREVELALAANNEAAKPTLCVWPGEVDREEVLAEGGMATQFSPWGVVAAKPPSEYASVRNRKIGVQDEGSQLIALAIAQSLTSEKNLLDACAGPGGKAALLSRVCKSRNMAFVANEPSAPRADLVKQVVPYGEVRSEDAREITDTFDAIVTDVPCTGIGALRRRPEVRWRRTPADLKNLLPLQRDIVQRALYNLNPGGLLAYATCSPHLFETKSMVEWINRSHPEVEEIEVSLEIPDSKVGKSLQLWTHRHQTDSMFLALFRKVG